MKAYSGNMQIANNFKRLKVIGVKNGWVLFETIVAVDKKYTYVVLATNATLDRVEVVQYNDMWESWGITQAIKSDCANLLKERIQNGRTN